MKALALIPDSSAEVISGGFLNTYFSVAGNANATSSGFGAGPSTATVKQTNNVGSTGIALLAFGKFKR